MVDDKAGRVIGLNWRMPHLLGKIAQPRTNIRIGFEARNDFDHLHEGHRIEEVIARKL